MNIIVVQPVTMTVNNSIVDQLQVCVTNAYFEELKELANGNITFNGVSYIGYTKLKQITFNASVQQWEVILESISDIEKRLLNLFPDPKTMSLYDYKLWAIETLKEQMEATLKAGVEFNGNLYNASKEKQDLLSNQLGLYAMNKAAGITDALTWNTKDGVCEEYEFEYLLQLANAMKAMAQPLVKAQQESEIQIKAADSREQVDAILAEFSY